jgi:hypothetical protein
MREFPARPLAVGLGAILVGLTAAAGNAAAQEPTYTIRLLDEPVVGASVRTTSVERRVDKLRIRDENGKVLKASEEDETREQVVLSKTLKGGQPWPAEMRRTYEKDLRGGRAGPLHGRTVAFVKREGKYLFLVDDGSRPDPEEPARWERKYNGGDRPTEQECMDPRRPVRVGEEWTLDVKLIGKALAEGAVLDAAKSRATCRLVRAYRKDGRQFGVLEVHAEFAPAEFQGLSLRPPLTASTKVVIDCPIDGSSSERVEKMSASMKGTAKLSRQGQSFVFEIDASFTAESSTVPVAAKP